MNQLSESDLQALPSPAARNDQLRRALFTPLPEAEQAVDLLDQAANAWLTGDRTAAASLLAAADSPQLRAFALDWMVSKAKWLQRTAQRDPSFPKIKTGARMPSLAVQRDILRRDGHRCRFCGTRVIARGVRSLLTREFPDAVPWPDKDQARMHGAFLALNATVDHLLPHARGGDNELSNLVTTCWPCNFSREDLLLHELDIHDPREFDPVVDAWDGLSRVLQPRSKAKTARDQKEEAVRQDWSDLDPLLIGIGKLAELGVSWKVRKTLLVEVRAGGLTIIPLAVQADGTVEAPWSVGPSKDIFRPFAEALASAVPGASVYETPKMWRVRVGGRSLAANELVEARDAVCAALADLAARMGSLGSGSPTDQ
jgi:5-methylcytosine-specific restriction endonuclease McrA